MFEISWAEIAVLGAVGVAVTGKRDLPRACNFVGHQLGRVVGLLQGARARADRFTHHNELRSLQNELRSGLRELDQVKTELAVAASSKGMVGRSLGATTLSANKTRPATTSTTTQTHTNNVAGGAGVTNSSSIGSSKYDEWKRSPSPSLPLNQDTTSRSPTFPSSLIATSSKYSISNTEKNVDTTGSNRSSNNSTPLSLSDFDFQIADSGHEPNISNNYRNSTVPSVSKSSEESEQQQQQQSQDLSTIAQSERAVMEEEWTKQGIGFRARAEQGEWRSDGDAITAGIGGDGGFGEPSVVDTTRATGSELLEHLERQCLIFDQYDRVVGEQEAEMERRVERIQNERLEQKRGNNDNTR